MYGRETDKKKQSCNPSPTTDTSGICDEVLSHEEEGSSPQINTFFNFLPSGISPHKGRMCLLDSIEEKEDTAPEAQEESEALVEKISSKRMVASLENDSVGPFLGSFEYHPDIPPEERSFRQPSHEHRKEYAGGCHVFYDPIAEYMEGLGKGIDWSHL